MREELVFRLKLDEIDFDTAGQPRYRSLIEYSQVGDLQLEPSLKSVDGQGPTGPFEVIFRLSEHEPARFLERAVGPCVTTLAGDEIDSRWRVELDQERQECRLCWGDQEPPETQVLHLHCTRSGETPALFLSFVEEVPLHIRRSEGTIPDPLQQPVDLEISRNENTGELSYDVFSADARQQLSPSYQFEPAFRVAAGTELQFEMTLLSSTDRHFVLGLGKDQVPVRISDVLESSDVEALRPSLRPTPETCVVTWQSSVECPAPAEGFLSFNLEMEPKVDHFRKERRHRVDPTIIEYPPIPTTCPTGSGQDVEGGE